MNLLSRSQVYEKDIDTLKRYLRYKLGGYKVAIKEVSTGNRFYRAVLWPGRPTQVKQLGYPPIEKAGLSRAARAGQQMFYASSAPPAVFSEVRAVQGHLLAISEWRLREPLWMHNLGYHPLALFRLGVRSSSRRNDFSSPIPEETKKNERIRKALSLSFIEDILPGSEYRYKQTVAINEMFFDRAEPLPIFADGPRFNRAAGTVYPTVRLLGAADNVAMQPFFVDRCLELRSVTYVHLEHVGIDGLSYGFLALAVARQFPAGNIDWEELSMPEVLRRMNVSLVKDRWQINGPTTYFPGFF
jgi:hypothetical protein